MAEFPFQKKAYACLEEYIFCIRRKDIDTKNDDKDSALLLLHTKISTLWSSIVEVMGKEREGSLNKWNKGEIIEIS